MAVWEEVDSQLFSSGEDLPHAIVYLNGYLYVGLKTSPGKLLKIDASDLSNYSVLTFPSDGDHNAVIDIIYSTTKTKLYCLFAHATGNYISEVDPTTLGYSDVIADDSFVANGNGSLATDETYLYVAIRHDNYIAKYDMSDWSLDDSAVVAANGHALDYDGTNLYETHSLSPGRITKINPTDLTSTEKTFASGSNIPTDDLAMTTDYVWVGCEDNNGYILKIAKSDLSISIIETGLSVSCWGVYSDGISVWAVFQGTPGSIVRINPSTDNATVYESPYNDTNEIVINGDDVFITHYTAPGRITKHSLETIMATIIKTWAAAVVIAKTDAFGGSVDDLAADQAYDYTGDVDLETAGNQGCQVLVETKLNFNASRGPGASAVPGGIIIDVFASLDGTLYDTIPHKSFIVQGSPVTLKNPDGDYQRFSFIVEHLAHFRIGLRTTGTEDTFDYRITHQLWILTNA